MTETTKNLVLVKERDDICFFTYSLINFDVSDVSLP